MLKKGMLHELLFQ